MTAPTIACVGTVTVDTIALVDRLPGEDERVAAGQVVSAGGGNAATAAVALARLGIPVEFVGVVGVDEAGDRAVEELRAAGVGTSLVERRIGVATAQSLVMVSRESGARSIVALQAPGPERIPGGFDWVHVDKSGYEALRQGARPAARVSIDDGNFIPGLDLGLIDLYVPTGAVLTERFPGHGAVQAAQLAIEAGCRTVVATAGPRGSFAVDSSGVVGAPALEVDVVSTLGAGDVFHGALLAAMLNGRSLHDSIRFANVAAALACRRLDGRSGIPTWHEVEHAVGRLGPGWTSAAATAEVFADVGGPG